MYRESSGSINSKNMNKKDLQILLECVNSCNANGLLRLEKLADVGHTVGKVASAITQMEDGDTLGIIKPSKPEEPVPGESETNETA